MPLSKADADIPTLPTARISGDGVRLACYSQGDSERPTVVFVHGYPDNHHVWDRMVDALKDDFHCVSYDVRGAGASERPGATRHYRLEHLANDLAAVIDWASPQRPAHLVGHRWGSIQSWGAVTDPVLAARIASFTSISGPCLDHVGHWLREQWRSDRAALLGQLRKSWYIALFHVPGVAAALWHSTLARRWPAITARLEGEPAPVNATRAADGAHGVKLYRANMLPLLRRPRERRTSVAVQVIIPTQDAFVGPGFVRGLDRWVEQLRVRRVESGHWVVLTHAEAVAQHCRDFINAHIEPGARQPGPPPRTSAEPPERIHE